VLNEKPYLGARKANKLNMIAEGLLRLTKLPASAYDEGMTTAFYTPQRISA